MEDVEEAVEEAEEAMEEAMEEVEEAVEEAELRAPFWLSWARLFGRCEVCMETFQQLFFKYLF